MRALRTAAICALWCAGESFSQAPTPAPAFDAASIKPSKAAEGHSGWHSRTAYLIIENQNLKQLIEVAYHLKREQVSGGPKWLDSDRFDIEARSAGPADEPQLELMLQTLLADRFQLVVHRETKLLSGYALVVAKGGLKVHSEEGKGSNSNSNRGRITAERVSMDKLAEILSRTLGSLVVNKTEANGAFSFQLEWTPDSGTAAAPPDGAPPDVGPSLFTVLQERLGVKLEAQKLPTEVLVIDKAEKPSEN